MAAAPSSSLQPLQPTGPQTGRTTHTPDGAFRFELMEAGMLGSGAHGIVRAALDVRNNKWVAIKVMPAALLGAVAKELIAQKRVDHPNIVKLMGTQVDLDKKRVYMVMVRACACHGLSVGELTADRALLMMMMLRVCDRRNFAVAASSSIGLPSAARSRRTCRAAT